MASIQRIERKKGVTYKITVLLGKDSNGKQIRQTTTFTPKPTLSTSKQEKEAQKFAMEFEEKALNGLILSGEKMTLEEYCKSWLEEAKKNLAVSTYNYYKDFIDTSLIPALGFFKLNDIKPKHIKDFVYNMKGAKGQELKASSIKKNLAIVKSIFKTAWLDEIISTNPAERVKPPKKQELTTDKVQCFNTEQTKTFLQLLDCGLEYQYAERTRTNAKGIEYKVGAYTSKHEIPTQFKVFYAIAIFGGLRKGEILGLTWNDINLETGIIDITKSVSYTKRTVTVKVPKTKTSVRTIHLPVSVINLLKDYRREWLRNKFQLGSAWQGDDDFLFIQADGKLMHPSTPYHKFKEIIKHYNESVEDEAKKLPNIPLHGLRHTSATLLIANNIAMPTVTKRLGHANTGTTAKFYVHALEETDVTASNTLETMFFQKATKEA